MQIKKDDIRNKILDISEKLFIKNGYDNTSLKQISEKSYISKSNIYRYFSSKEEIYEILAGPARVSAVAAIEKFSAGDYTGKYTPDKIDEISEILSEVMSRHRKGMLIMLNCDGGNDKAFITQKLCQFFVEGCPLKDEAFKIQVASLLLTGLIDILLKYEDEQEIRYRLKLLFSYHYLGLNGVKASEL